MKEVTGVLRMLGSGSSVKNQVGKSFVYYSSVEIGDAVLQKLRTAQALGDYIGRGLGEEVTLFLNGKMIVAVRLANGKVYFWKRSVLGPLLGVLPCLFVFIGLMSGVNNVFYSGLGAIAVYAVIFGGDLKQLLSVQPKFVQMGGVPLKS
jgi:hypothetical protein